MFARRFVVILALAVLVLGAAVARPSSGAGAETRHVVRPGETLWGIAAAKYGGDPREGIWRIEQRNGLESSAALAPGTVLYLPP
jgi:nucleoid-associated protein YgaU